MKSWDWGLRLSQAGIQRLEFSDDVTRDDFEGFLDEALARLTLAAIGTGDARQMRRSNIRFGAVGLKGESAPAPQSGVPVTVSMAEEVATLSWLQEQVQGGRGLPLLEAEAIVRSLSIAMHGGQRIILPMLHLKEFDQYTTTHSLNVSVLAMALAEFMGHGPRAIQAIGMAGLLHDLGKIRVPRDILTKPGKLTPEERAVMNRHPIDGARLILEDERQLDLAAVVAYEHHVMIDGGGYPTFRFARDCHEASKLVHVCDVFDALRTNRPYRDAWATERAIGYVAERSNIEFAPAVADAFARMMTAYEHQVTVLPAATATATVEPSRPPPLAPPAS
jgi:putative nucleotidyltransferase with HDIG domain